jgi:hypothetical protein
MADNNYSFERPDGSFFPAPSGRRVNVTAATLAVTRAKHCDKIITLNLAAGIAVTLPAAVGSGDKYEFLVGTTFTGDCTIAVANATDVMAGMASLLDNDSTAQTAYAATGTDDTLTMNGTTKGGLVGDRVELVDIDAGVWAVHAQLVVPAGSNIADVFSATVA